MLKKILTLMKNIYIDKYNDIFQNLSDNKFIPERFNKKEDKGKKQIANKRTEFRRQTKSNYFIHNNRLVYKYRKKKSKQLIIKFLLKRKLYP